MLAKCANPTCSTPFLYLHEGKLFRLEGAAISHHLPTPLALKPNQKIEFFWLCSNCATRMVVVFQPGIGVTVRPIVRVHKAAS